MIKKKAEPLDNINWENFCQEWTSPGEFFGHGTDSYIEAFDVNTTQPGHRNSARASASRLLAKPVILERINQLLEEGGLNDQFVDKQLQLLITQKADMGTSLGAIREYNKLKKRVDKGDAERVVKIVVVSGDKPKDDKPF